MPHGSPLRAISGSRRQLAWLVLWGWLAVAWAGVAHAGVDGSAVPGSGGGFAGPADPGARGVIYNPAAIARGEGPELLVDVGLFRQELRTALRELNDAERGVYWLGQPSAALSIPLGPVAFGGFVHGPYSRGSDADPSGPRRFLSIGSDLQLVEGGLVAAVTLAERITFAGGLRIGHLTFRSDSALDFGYFLNDSLELTGDDALELGDPFLEGQQLVGPISGVGIGWMAGLTVRLPGEIDVHAAFRPRWAFPIRGPFALKPSNDLSGQIEGEGVLRLPFPARLHLAATIPLAQGRLRLLPEVEWVGWRGAADVPIFLQDLRITAEDDDLDLLFAGISQDQEEFLEAAGGEVLTELGWRDVINPGLQAEWDVSERTTVRGGFFWGSRAVPDAVVTPSNVDFATYAVRAAVGWRALPQLRLAGTVEGWPSPIRDVRTSPPANPTVPSGNGLYQLVLWRAGLTAQFFLERP